MTQQEVRAMLARVNARQLRVDAGIRATTVAAAFGLSRPVLCSLESGRYLPCSGAGLRWARFVAALERRARFLDGLTAETPADRFW